MASVTQSTTHQPDNPNTLIAPSMAFIIGFGIIIVAFGLFCALFIPQIILPPEGSIQAQNTDMLFRVLLGVGGGVFMLVQGLLLYSALRFRARPGDTSDALPVHGNTTLEIIWTIIPSIVVVVISILAFVVWTTNTATSTRENIINGDSVPTNAIGQRYAWNFTYETGLIPSEIDEEIAAKSASEDCPLCEQPITLNANELHVYLGEQVSLDMNSEDVIHSFWVPAMRVKQDVLPGYTTQIRFTPIRVADTTYPTRYRLVCTELCGGGHGQMYSWLVVHEDQEAMIDEWYQPQIDDLLRIIKLGDPVSLGSSQIEGYACSGCHVLDDKGWQGQTGPALNGIGSRAADRAAASGLQDGADYIAHSIRLPQDYFVPGYAGVIMPAHVPVEGTSGTYMPQSELINIIAYLCIQTDSGDPADNTCGLEFDDAGQLADINAARTYLTEVTDAYQP